MQTVLLPALREREGDAGVDVVVGRREGVREGLQAAVDVVVAFEVGGVRGHRQSDLDVDGSRPRRLIREPIRRAHGQHQRAARGRLPSDERCARIADAVGAAAVDVAGAVLGVPVRGAGREVAVRYQVVAGTAAAGAGGAGASCGAGASARARAAGGAGASCGAGVSARARAAGGASAARRTGDTGVAPVPRCRCCRRSRCHRQLPVVPAPPRRACAARVAPAVLLPVRPGGCRRLPRSRRPRPATARAVPIPTTGCRDRNRHDDAYAMRTSEAAIMAQSTGMSATSAGGTGGHQRAAAVLAVAAIAAMTLAPLAALAAGEDDTESAAGRTIDARRKTSSDRPAARPPSGACGRAATPTTNEADGLGASIGFPVDAVGAFGSAGNGGAGVRLLLPLHARARRRGQRDLRLGIVLPVLDRGAGVAGRWSRRIPGFSSSSSSAWSRAAGCPIRSCSSSTTAASGRCRRTSMPTQPM